MSEKEDRNASEPERDGANPPPAAGRLTSPRRGPGPGLGRPFPMPPFPPAPFPPQGGQPIPPFRGGSPFPPPWQGDFARDEGYDNPSAEHGEEDQHLENEGAESHEEDMGDGEIRGVLPPPFPPLSARVPFPPPPGRPFPPFRGGSPFPPPGAGFPPPPGRAPFPMGAPFPPPQMEGNYDEDEYVGEDSNFDETPVGADDANVSGGSPRSVKGLVSNPRIAQMRSEGLKVASKNRRKEFAGRALLYLFCTLGALIGLVAIVSAAIWVLYEVGVLSNEDVPDLPSAAIEKISPIVLDRSSKEGRILETFYSKLGDLQKIPDRGNAIYKGTVKIGSKTRSFECIKKNTGEAFLNIVGDSDSAAYLVPFFDSPPMRLLDGTVTGKSRVLGDKDRNIFTALAMYDEALFLRAFRRIESAARNPLEYAGEAEIEGRKMDVLSLEENGGNILRYYFDKADGLLARVTLKNQAGEVRIDFSNYTTGNAAYKYPKIKKIYVGGKLFAIVEADIIASNKWIFFPDR